MTILQTTYNADRKEAKTVHPMGPAKERFGGNRDGERVLEITTSKYEGILKTNASVFFVHDHGKTHCFGLGSPKDGDFSATLNRAQCPRATEKVIRQAHEAALAEFDAVLEAATKHY